MKYWVREVDIDGYRCDVAGFVPTDFWNQVRKELDTIKPVFILAEWEARDLYAQAFDMTYSWSWNDTVHRVTMGQADVNSLFVYYSWNEKAFPHDCYRMTFAEGLYIGRYTDYFGRQSVELSSPTQLELEPWGYRVFVK